MCEIELSKVKKDCDAMGKIREKSAKKLQLLQELLDQAQLSNKKYTSSKDELSGKQSSLKN